MDADIVRFLLCLLEEGEEPAEEQEVSKGEVRVRLFEGSGVSKESIKLVTLPETRGSMCPLRAGAREHFPRGVVC